jgi:DNA-binding MarR family transcriptional regulator
MATQQDRLAAWRDLQWANALIMAQFRRDLSGRDLTIEEFDVLIHLAAGPLPLQELVASMVLGQNLSRSGLTRLLDRMESAGLVRRRLSRTDRRRFDVSLTPKGRARFEAIWPEHEEGIRQYFSEPLSDSDVISLRSVLAKLISANANRHTAAF